MYNTSLSICICSPKHKELCKIDFVFGRSVSTQVYKHKRLGTRSKAILPWRYEGLDLDSHQYLWYWLHKYV